MYDKIFNLAFDTVTTDGEYKDEGFSEYKNWYYMDGGQDTPDTKQLEWILNNPNIANSLKRELSRKIANKSAALEEEEDTLTKVGFAPKTLQEHIESDAEEIRIRQHTNIIKFLVAGIVMITCYICFSVASSSPTVDYSGVVGTTATCCFGIAMICFMRAWDSKVKFDRAEIEARECCELLVGHALQEQITNIREERKEFYELDKVIAKTT